MTLFRYPKIFEDETVGPEAKKLFTEAEVKTYIETLKRKTLKQIKSESLLQYLQESRNFLSDDAH